MLNNTNNIEECHISHKKTCRFCGETIQALAIKCRYCGEWLESPVRDIAGNQPSASGGCHSAVQDTDGTPVPQDIFEGRPSYVAMAGSFILAALLAVTAFTIMAWPAKQAGEDAQSAKILIGLLILLFTASWILIKMAVLKSTFYRLTADRLEYRRGILSKKIDNIDLFRISDYTMDRTIIDRILGTGTIKLFTSDKTDAEFLIFKIKNPQRVFDILAKTTIAADRKANTIHIE